MKCYNYYTNFVCNYLLKEGKNYEISRWIRYEFDDEASPENAGADGQRNEGNEG